MKAISLFLFLALLLSPFFSRPPLAAVSVGSGKEEVLKAHGPPRSHVKSGAREVLHYDHAIIEIVDGTVRSIQSKQARSAPPAEGNRTAPAVESTRNRDPDAVKDYRLGGDSVDLSKMLKKGAVTIVVFYADW